MDWKDVGRLVADAAPVLGGLLPIPGAGAVGSMIASAFGTKAEPDAVAAAIRADPEAALKLRALEENNRAQLERLALECETRQQAEVNATMRAEAGAADPFVRRWRPTIGYVVAFQLALLGLAVFAVSIGAIWTDGTKAAALFGGLAELCGALTGILGVELMVLGVNITQRTKDKAIAAGHPPPAGLVGALAERIAR